METRELVWSRADGGDKIEGSVDIREIKEIRMGKESKVASTFRRAMNT
jgi:phosphatidylinositol phospholipase C gamma-1